MTSHVYGDGTVQMREESGHESEKRCDLRRWRERGQQWRAMKDCSTGNALSQTVNKGVHVRRTCIDVDKAERSRQNVVVV